MMKQTAGSKYFIYADDDEDDRNTMIEMIAAIDQDLQVIGVSNGLAVLNCLKQLEPSEVLPCFILLDINMPVLNGFETLELLKLSDFKEIPVILYSTSHDTREEQSAISMGAENLISKPFSLKGIEEITSQFAGFCHDLPTRRK